MIHRFRAHFLNLSIAFLLLWPLSASATMVLPLTLEEIVSRAGMIFVGQCVLVEEGLDEGGRPSHFVSFTVAEPLKGVDEDAITIKQFAATGDVSDLSLIPDLQPGESAILLSKTLTSASSYQAGETYLLFLYPESDWGFTSPVGYGQGLFAVSESESEARVQNKYQNLFLNIDEGGETSTQSLATSASPRQRALDLDFVLDEVQDLLAPRK